ncbi:DNA primase [Hoeflea poritis]|uniref:DNA primase n=1 Tax=Hoeflea poritis TaxID=2993659 RepID=A0ABT4VRE4_9HYPH|nr:DNA primase [Hoeflea poritis]MDA4847278.1 DNA primase [Hoeflea poritis]
MRFDSAFLDELRDRVPISDVIGKRVAWDKRKTNVSRGDWWACCPFHGEKTPSFHCEDRKGRYHCFGCGVSGDHFRFLTELDGLSFPEAVRYVADMAGVALPAPDPRAAQREKERATLIDVLEMATRFFQDRLQASDGAKARAYLRDRGLSGRTIETFRLGYAPDGRNILKEFLASKGAEKQQIEACGLVVHGPDIAVSYDRFRDRIMFPILSARERVIAYGGRAMSADIPAKYINSNETELFHKGRVLYNLARARRAVQGADGAGTVVAVEGYMDVIALHQAGIENAVAPLGTALTEDQLELLWRATPEPVLCFDGDDAGTRAAYRAVDLALAGLRPGRSVRFALLPQGKDPDDLVREEGRAPFDAVLKAARPLADMVWMRETASGVFDTPEKRAALEAAFGKVTAVIGDETVRRHYAQDMRDRLAAFLDSNRPTGGTYGKGGGFQGGDRRRQAAGRGAKADRRIAMTNLLARSTMVRGQSELPTPRESMLALTVINHPELLIAEFDEVSAIEFENRQLAILLEQLLDLCAGGASPDREAALQHLSGGGHEDFIARLKQQIRYTRDWTASEEAAFEDAREGFIQALALYKRGRALKQQKNELERDIAEATESGDGEAVPKLMQSLQSVQMEYNRLERQEAIVEGFGVLSGRVRGAAGK